MAVDKQGNPMTKPNLKDLHERATTLYQVWLSACQAHNYKDEWAAFKSQVPWTIQLQESYDNYIEASIGMYLNIINLFQFILSNLGVDTD